MLKSRLCSLLLCAAASAATFSSVTAFGAKFTTRRCEKMTSSSAANAYTMSVIMKKMNVTNCAGFKPNDDGAVVLSVLELGGQNIESVEPLRLFTYENATVDLSNNAIVDLAPLKNLKGTIGLLDLKHNQIRDVAALTNFRGQLTLDDNQIAHPEAVPFRFAKVTMKGNTSENGRIYDKTLDRVLSYFDHYKDAGDFSFFREFYAPKVQQYITMKTPSIESMIKDAKHYYSTKKDINYFVEVPSFRAKEEGDTTKATFEVRLAWAFEPKAGEDDDIPNTRNTFAREVRATSEIVFNKDMKIISYTEKKIHRDKYKTLSSLAAVRSRNTVEACLSSACDKVENGDAMIPAGTLVDDDFVTASGFQGNRGGTVIDFRRVKYNKKSYYVMERYTVWSMGENAECCNVKSGETEECPDNVIAAAQCASETTKSFIEKVVK